MAWTLYCRKWNACTRFILPKRQDWQASPASVCNFAQHGSESQRYSPAQVERNATLIVYEYPFNERIRTLLRLEDLYEKFKFFVDQDHPLQHHVALATIFDMLEVAGRADLKSDLLQELERQKQSLLGYRSNPNVAPEMLDAVLAELDTVSGALVGAQGKTGQNVRDNEWLMTIRGRSMIPAVPCDFELPSYYAE